MLVKCISNLVQSLPEEIAEKYGRSFWRSGLDITVGKVYIVYALTISHEIPWYYIISEDQDHYPIFYPAVLFEIINGLPSKYWKMSFSQNQFVIGAYDFTIAFNEWVDDPYGFYDALSDGASHENEIFGKYRRLMEVEFPDPTIKKFAIHLNENWVRCPKCEDSYEVNINNGMIICNTCEERLNNPIYKAVTSLDF